MNADDFEQQLHRRREKQLPPEWRADILQAAYAERAEVATQQRSHRPWFTVKRLRWGALAAVWLLIASFHFTEPSAMRATHVVAASEPPQREQLWREQQKLLAELLDANPSVPKAPPLPPPAPRSGSRGRANQTILFI